jgi:hypothetical protein
MNYTLLRPGDQLPMVGVLQLLLKRTGTSLAVDGNFGPITVAAVKSLQRHHGLLQDGIVGEKTWTKLTIGVSLPILDAVDVWDPTFQREDASFIRKVGGSPLLIGGACNGVQQIINDIRSLATNLFLLRFHGHGGLGVASVSTGHGELDPKMRERSDIWDDPQIMGIMGGLRSVFGPYGCVEFIECETGRGPKGRFLLSRLASQLGVPVTAAVNDQPFGRGQRSGCMDRRSLSHREEACATGVGPFRPFRLFPHLLTVRRPIDNSERAGDRNWLKEACPLAFFGNL